MKKNSRLTERTPETKVLRDPIHGYIRIEYQILWDLINSAEFQRLRRIHQLGGVSLVYHNAEHTRFAHSLGVYELTRRMIEEVRFISSILSEEQQVEVMIAALLHDIGHGPFSHFYESISLISHETLGMEIISSGKTEIHQILSRSDSQLPKTVVSILQKRSDPPLLSSMISSQLDADRMDYLLRDAYETGTTYGDFDLERVIRTLRASPDSIYIKKSGIHSVEDYIMARYQMYFQVYRHPDSYGYELLIERFFKRAEYAEQKALQSGEQIPMPYQIFFEECRRLKNPKRMLAEGKIELLDEAYLSSMIRQALLLDDPVLCDLARRILRRRLFVWIDQPDEKVLEEIRARLSKLGMDEEYYLNVLEECDSEYLPYHESSEPILVEENDGSRKLLSQSSQLADALLRVRNEPVRRIYFPREALLPDPAGNETE